MTLLDLWPLMPLLILACGSLVVLLFGAVLPGRYGTVVGLVACLGAALWALQVPPQTAVPSLGVAFTPFSRFFIVIFTVTAAATLLLSHDYLRRPGMSGEEYPATILFTAFGMTVLVSSATLLNLFLGLESLTFGFYILVAYDRARPASAEAGLKYLLLGAISAAFIAFGIALLYAGSGTLAIAGAAGAPLSGLTVAGWGFLLAGLAFKVSLVPAHLWTPDVYQGAPTPVVAFLSTGSKGAAIAFLLLLLPRLATLGPLRLPLWLLALLSMTVGNLAALRQPNLKRLLAYSSVAQMGYVALALLSGGRGYEAAAFYVVAYTAMNLAAFGVIASLEKTGPLELVDDYRGLGYRRPVHGAVLALAMFALAGIPPTIGFTGKFAIFFAAVRSGEVALAVIGILTAAASAYYYLRVVVNLYLRSSATESAGGAPTAPEAAALALAALTIVVFGVYPAPLFDLVAAVLR